MNVRHLSVSPGLDGTCDIKPSGLLFSEGFPKLSRQITRVSKEEQLDRVFHALSDQTRRALVARLADGPSIVTELAEPFDMSLPAVSKHLKVLESARLIERNVEGRIHRCSLLPDPLHQAELWLSHYRAFWDSTLDALASYVERDANSPKG